jgi:hypothetical protein
MCRKRSNHGIAIIGVAVLVFLSVACTSTSTSTSIYKKISPDELSAYEHESGKYVTETRHKPASKYLLVDGGWIFASVENLKEDSLQDRIEDDKVYRVYLTSRGNMGFSIDRIDGLVSIKDGQPIIERNREKRREAESIAEEAYRQTREEAQRQAQEAERQAQEAERQAREAERRHMLERFIIFPSNFQPSNYTRADLFAAVAASERLSSAPLLFLGYDPVYDSKDFVSDVFFVSQNGTDIIFRTEDNAIRKRMKVGSRTGLTAGQRVRIYYEAFNPSTREDWQVVAIERL